MYNYLNYIKRLFYLIFFYFYLFTQAFANILISEVFPNTTDDKALEYIELYNSGSDDTSLSGYYLQDKSGKNYNFGTGEILISNQKKKYFRTETKIILNNTKEVIYLYNSGSLVDSFSYDTSEKGEVIIRDILNGDFENTNTGTGLINTQTGVVEDNSGSSDNQVGATGSGNILEIPEIDIEVQSGIEYLTGNIWKCKKEDCKVNLNLEKVFTGIYNKHNYNCLWDFGTGSIFSTGTTEKCNPGYVDYEIGTFEVLVKIYEKGNNNNYKTGGLIVKNDFWEVVENTDSGSIEDNNGIIDSGTGEVLEVPEINIEVQSGIEYLTGNIWGCKKEDCKVNLNLEKVFTGIYNKHNYNCLWDFGTGSIFSTGTTEKCNPGYVDYEIGTFEVLAKIYEKGDKNNYKTGSIIIKNDFWDINKTTGTTNTGTINTNTGIIESQTGVLVPEIIIDFQNPSYLLEKDIKKQKYSCDRTKTECKVNLDLRSSFSGSYKESDFNCQIDFGFGSGNLTGQENKCNPLIIVYPIGNYDLNFKITSKTNSGFFSTGSIQIENKGYIKPIKKSSSSGGGGDSSSSIIYIKKPEIIIQSGLEESEGKYKCKKEDCKINLKYDVRDKDERCLWNFKGGDYKVGTIEKCNPGYIDYGFGEFSIKLKVYQKDNISNFKETYLKFYNKEENQDILQEKENEEELKKEINILLQGKKTDYKEEKEGIIICNGVTKCNINLISNIKGYKKKKDLVYNWDFGNGQKSDKANPSGVWFEKGEYDVILKVYENNKFFGEKKLHISVLGEDLKEKEEVKQENYNYDYLKIFKILPNPKGNDNKEWIEIKNNGDNLINLKGCKLDDDIGKGSKAYKIKENLFIKPGKTKKIYKTFSKLNLNNTGDSVNLFCDSKLIDSLSWDFKVKDGYYLNHERLFKGKIKAYVLRIIDGDTILVKLNNSEKIKVRLIGVDTPENNSYKNYYEKYGKEASLFTKKYLENKNIIIENDVDNIMDIYGRRLAYVYIDGINFNKLLLEKGIARPYFKYHFKYEEDFESAYKIAQKQKLGIWADKEFKKIILKELKKDDLLDENIEEIIKIEDKNQNNIPDEFEEIDYVQNGTGEIIEKIDKDKSILKYDLFINKTFTQSIRKTKSGLKISGETIPFTQVSFFLSGTGKNISVLSDKYGKYEFLILDFDNKGVYLPKTVLLDKLGNEFIINAKKEIVIDEDYLKVLKNKKIKTTRKVRTKKKRSSKNNPTIIKDKIKKQEKTINLIIPKAEAQDDYFSSEEEINVIYVFLLMVISLILTGVLFKKRGII